MLGMAGDSQHIGFNVPFPRPDATHRAALCAIDMLAHIAPLQTI